MKIIVPVKRVIDHAIAVRLKPDGSAVETDNVKMSLNPYDETAVEEAVRLKERGIADDVLAVSVGAAAAAETLRTALAMGADRALLLQTDTDADPLTVAKLLRQVCTEEKPDLVLMGRQAIDEDAAQVCPMLAALLGWGQATAASAIAIDGNTVEVQCEVEAGRKILCLALPAVVTADLRLNEPRFVTLPGIVKARKKPLSIAPAETRGLAPETRVEVLGLRKPAPRPPGTMVNTVEEFLDRLFAGDGRP
jgi:electron transfer flavoprotein beta subunit